MDRDASRAREARDHANFTQLKSSTAWHIMHTYPCSCNVRTLTCESNYINKFPKTWRRTCHLRAASIIRKTALAHDMYMHITALELDCTWLHLHLMHLHLHLAASELNLLLTAYILDCTALHCTCIWQHLPALLLNLTWLMLDCTCIWLHYTCTWLHYTCTWLHIALLYWTIMIHCFLLISGAMPWGWARNGGEIHLFSLCENKLLYFCFKIGFNFWMS